jgi:hypothetical protein
MSGMRALLVCTTLVGCGSYHLATDISGPTGANRTVDVLACKEEARDYSERQAAQVRGFLTGLLLPGVGIAVDISAQKQESRMVFQKCLTERGYTMRMGVD